MPSEYNDIAQIEAYLTRRMSAKDRKAFEQRLQKEAALRQELEVYRPLLSGFEVLQEEALVGEMQQWENEWSQAMEEDTDLIEWYLKDELGEFAHAKVAERIQSDSAFAKKVADYQNLLDGFSGLASESLAANMKQWEVTNTDEPKLKSDSSAKVVRLRPLLVRIAAAAVILLLVGVGVQQYMQSQYSSETLVANYYQNPGNDNLMRGEQGETDAITKQFQEAHKLLQNQDFARALTAFENLLTNMDQADLDALTRKYIQENAEWNYALALLGTKRSDQETIAALEVIIANPEHEYQQKGVALKKKLNSFWR